MTMVAVMSPESHTPKKTVFALSIARKAPLKGEGSGWGSGLGLGFKVRVSARARAGVRARDRVLGFGLPVHDQARELVPLLLLDDVLDRVEPG